MSYRKTLCPVVMLAAVLAPVLAAAPAGAQQKKPETPVSGPDIVVTGISLKTAQAALAACLERRCPPDQDIDATLAVAETQFVAGDYKGARTTMLKSLGRNRRFGKTYPVPVSDLQRANSRVAAHLGEQDAYFNGALDVLGTLKGGLPATDGRVLGAYMELGDAFAKTGRLSVAIDTYRKTARRAHELHLPQIEGYALLRVAMAYAGASSRRQDAEYQNAVAAADALISSTDPALVTYAAAAKLLKFRLDVKRGEPGAVDRMIAAYRDAGRGQARPVLLYAPAVDLPESPIDRGPSGGANAAETLTRVQLASVEDQWIDVGFEVAPDGKVRDVEVLRQSKGLAGGWVQPVLTAVGGRRYAPLAANSPGALRVERYSFTAAWTTVTGTRIRVRAPRTQIEVVDLSLDTPKGS